MRRVSGAEKCMKGMKTMKNQRISLKTSENQYMHQSWMHAVSSRYFLVKQCVPEKTVAGLGNG